MAESVAEALSKLLAEVYSGAALPVEDETGEEDDGETLPLASSMLVLLIDEGQVALGLTVTLHKP